MSILLVLLFVAVFAPVIAPYAPDEVLIGKEDVKNVNHPAFTYWAARPINRSTLWARMAMCVICLAALCMAHAFLCRWVLLW
ncbi:MAG: hypothetical protein M5U34_35055 [Chloroflexi bacterium]|nr:hypothetical protein [Chloroflexota bacterium]